MTSEELWKILGCHQAAFPSYFGESCNIVTVTV